MRAPHLLQRVLFQSPARRCGKTLSRLAILIFLAPHANLFTKVGIRCDAAPEQGAQIAPAADLTTVIADYQRKLAASPHDVDAEIGLARAYRAVHNHNEAKNILDRASREHPRNPEPLLILGDLEIEMQTYEAAVGHLTAALALTPDDARARIRLAVAYRSKNDSRNALAQLTTVLTRDSQNALAHYERARIYSDQNQNTEALRDAETAFRLKPNPPARLLLATILLRPQPSDNHAASQNRCARAAELLESSAATQPTDSESTASELPGSEMLFLLLRAYQCAGQNEKAQQALARFESASRADRTTKENQTEAKHLVQQANNAAMRNDPRTAFDLLHQALEKDPSYGAAYSQLAKLYYSAGDVNKAEDAIAKALARDPYQPDFLYVLGKIREKQGNLDEALATFQKTALVNPKESDAYFEMGSIYQQRNDRARARVAYEKALNLSPGDPDYRKALASLNQPLQP
jgi:tetratricopeptide (TPR) repeat protein